MYRDIPEDLRALIEPVVEDRGWELVDVENSRGSAAVTLRVTIDSTSGDGRVPVESCAEVSRELETVLETAQALAGPYRLEVSSPGLNRILAREKDFRAASGREIKLVTRRPISGRRRYRGVLVDFCGGTARLLVDGVETQIDFEDIERANMVYSFGPADFRRDRCTGLGSQS